MARVLNLHIEQTLGIWWKRGLSRTEGRNQYPVIKSLNDHLKSLTSTYACRLTPEQLQMDPAVRSMVLAVFEAHGPQLWPAPDKPRPAWLTDARVNTLDGRYPRNLYFSIDVDRLL